MYTRVHCMRPRLTTSTAPSSSSRYSTTFGMPIVHIHPSIDSICYLVYTYNVICIVVYMHTEAVSQRRLHRARQSAGAAGVTGDESDPRHGSVARWLLPHGVHSASHIDLACVATPMHMHCHLVAHVMWLLCRRHTTAHVLWHRCICDVFAVM